MAVLDSIVAGEVFYAAGGFAVFAVLLVASAWHRCGRPRFKLQGDDGEPSWRRWAETAACGPWQGRWIVAAMFVAWAVRLLDLAAARIAGAALNPPRTVVWWAMIDLTVTWVAARWLTGGLGVTDDGDGDHPECAPDRPV